MIEQEDWLEDLKQRHPGPSTRLQRNDVAPTTSSSAETHVGGVFRIVAMDHDHRPGVAIVVDVDETTRSATVVLMTTEIEMGGDRDLLLSSDKTGLGYDVLAQADVFGYVWLVQLERRLGELDVSYVDQLVELQNAEPMPLEPDLRSGTPIVARSDIRWQFKAAELDRLQDLTGPCTSQLIDGEPKPSIDPIAFRTPVTGSDQLELLEYLLAVTDLLREKQVDLPIWLLDAILDDELVAVWRRCGLFDAYTGLISLVAQALPGIKDEPVPMDDGHDSNGDLEVLRVQVLSERRRSGVTSVPMFFLNPSATSRLVEKVALPGGLLVQCVPVANPIRSRKSETESSL